jgi:magnesium-transporting ATPase (P-type)
MKSFENNSPLEDGGIEQQLWEYIDGISTDSEKSAIEKMLDSNLEWKNKYNELLQVNQLLKSSELEQPSLRFTKNVMDNIAKYHIAPVTKQYINNRIVWGIGIFFLTMIIGFIVYGFGQVNWTSGQTGTNSLGVDTSKIDFSKIFSNTYVNVFMMINIVIGLALLDRVLANKRKQFRTKKSY